MQYILNNFEKEINRLIDYINQPYNSIIRDAALKRFEITAHLAWKSIQAYAKKQGILCNSPRSCIKTAFQLKLIEHDKNWLAMIEDRNYSVHLYKEEMADKLSGLGYIS